MDFDRSVFAPAFAASGIWIPIRVTSQGSPPIVTTCYAGYRRPDNLRVNGSLSNDYEIDYQFNDLPDLDEGYGVELLDANGNAISGETYRVREPPQVTDNPNDDQTGYFRRALLTKTATLDVEVREDGGYELRE